MTACGIWKALVGPLPNWVYLAWPHMSVGPLDSSCLGEVFVLHPVSFLTVPDCSQVV